MSQKLKLFAAFFFRQRPSKAVHFISKFSSIMQTENITTNNKHSATTREKLQCLGAKNDDHFLMLNNEQLNFF